MILYKTEWLLKYKVLCGLTRETDSLLIFDEGKEGSIRPSALIFVAILNLEIFIFALIQCEMGLS